MFVCWLGPRQFSSYYHRVPFTPAATTGLKPATGLCDTPVRILRAFCNLAQVQWD